MRTALVPVDGVHLHLEEGGRGHPLLLLHGLGGASTSWALNAPTLSKRFRTVAPDLPGFGGSDKPRRRYTPAYFVETLEDLLDALDIQRTHVVGSSMGGQVALEFALRRPDRVARVVAVAPGGVPPASFEGTPALEQYKAILDAETEADVVRAREATAPGGARDGPVTRTPAEVLAYVQSPGAREAFQSALEESGRARRLGPLLTKLDPPPLFVWGDADPIIPLGVCTSVLDGLDSLHLAEFHGCGHSPHAEQPALFNELVAAFLTDRLDAFNPPGELVELRDGLV